MYPRSILSFKIVASFSALCESKFILEVRPDEPAYEMEFPYVHVSGQWRHRLPSVTPMDAVDEENVIRYVKMLHHNTLAAPFDRGVSPHLYRDTKMVSIGQVDPAFEKTGETLGRNISHPLNLKS